MYYPKSQIVIDLYTNGQEYVIKSTQENYVGPFWKTSDGKFFTGKTPEAKNIQELTLSQSSITAATLSNNVYVNNSYVITNSYTKLYPEFSKIEYIPSPFNPQPTQDDYALEEFTRYFCKKTNEVRYLEINKETYEKLVGQDPTYLWQVYTPFRYQWNISGEKEQVYSTNKKVTEYMITKFNLYSLNKFLKEDYLKFFKPSQSKNPSTSILNTNTLPTPQTNGGGYQGKELLS
jgi:hypothetical protein